MKNSENLNVNEPTSERCTGKIEPVKLFTSATRTYPKIVKPTQYCSGVDD